jgi:tetratricopeptide (TPR) repeat protein
MLDCQIYGLNPGGHHGTNVLFHMATVILLFLVLRQMTGSLWRSAFVAAVFAIHPLRAESVAWISERKDVLSGFFFMLTLAAYLRYVRRPFSAGRYAAVAVFFTLGLMSKAMLVTLPFVLLLLDFWPLKRFQTLETKKPIQRLVLEKIPLLLLSAVFCIITIWAQKEAIIPDRAVSVPWRFGNAFCSYAIYIRQLILPSGLAPFYPHLGVSLPVWEVGASIALLAGISWGVFAGRKKHPYLITGWCWYLGMLVPVIGIMQVGLQAHADRYTYLPQIGLVVMATWLIADWCASLRYRRAVLSTTAAVVLAVLAVTAHRQTRHWRDRFSLWTHTLACTERNDLAHNNMGTLLGEQEQFEKAIFHLEKAMEINPAFPDTYYNLGVVFSQQGRFDKAIPYFEKALKIKPDYGAAHSNLGVLFTRQGQTEKAIFHLEKSLSINPDSAEAHYNLGISFDRQGQIDKAILHFEKSLAINPNHAEANCRLGNLFSGQTNFVAAIRQYERALRINPNYVEVQNNLAWILATCPDAAFRDGPRAVALARSSDRLSRGTLAPVLDTLAAAYAEAGQYPEAVATARRALAVAAGQESVADGLRARLRLYEAGIPYHETREAP